MVKAFALAVLGVFTFVAATGVAAAGATPAQKCASSKIRETGKKADRKLKCWSKEVMRPGGLAACNASVEGKFADRFARAEAKGGCLSTGDAGVIEAKVDGFVDDVVTALTGSPAGTILGTDAAKRCATAKLKAAGKTSAARLRCHAKAATSSLLDAVCISKAEARYGQRWDAAEARGGCATTSDEATIAAEVEAFVSDAVRALPSASTTTTTTTSTTTTTWPQGTTTGITIQSGGLTRTYNVRIPPGYDGTVAVPLVLDFHGSTANGQIQEAVSGFRELGDANGFIVAYPDGYHPGELRNWNAGTCCDPAVADGVDDVGFARAVVADIASKADIDPFRVYATGLSSGGGMAHRLGCEAADVFAAVAPVAFPLNLDPLTACQPVRPISVLHFAGLTDEIIPYDGGEVVCPTCAPGGQVFVVPSALASFAHWAATSGCGDGPPDVVEDLGNGASCATHTACSAGVAVGLCSIHGTVFSGHLLYFILQQRWR